MDAGLENEVGLEMNSAPWTDPPPSPPPPLPLLSFQGLARARTFYMSSGMQGEFMV